MKTLKHFLSASILSLIVVASADAATSVVTTTLDSGPGALRTLVASASPGDTITFTNTLAGQTIFVTNGNITLDKNLIIDGSTLASPVSLNGGHTNRIFLVTNATVLLDSLTLTNGYDNGPDGGGAVINYGNLTVNRCTFASNYCGNAGGAINAYAGSLIANNSTFYKNNCGYAGGAIICYTPATVNQCTIVSNAAVFGGGIMVWSFGVSVNQCTVAGNFGPNGGGIYEFIGQLALTNSIVAGNSSGGNNLDNLRNDHPVIFGGVNLTNGAPLLAPLGNYGGPTLTMPPLPGSPAIDAGAATTFSTDQRGFTRSAGAGVDIGAVELQSVPTSLTVVTTTSDDVNSFDINGVSLREAVTYATNNATITFATNLFGSTILLTNGSLLLNKSFNIDASALAGGIIINGNHTGNNGVFDSISGITNVLTALTITNGLTASSAGGGGIVSRGNLTVNRCTLAVNSAAVGGGIYNEGVLTVNQSTISGNLAFNLNQEGGGGIFIRSGTVKINQSTLSGNHAESSGGGIHNFGTLNLTNSIVCSNTAASSGPNISGSINFGANNLVDANALLAPLGNYGGPTLTMPPVPGSPAIDGGSDSAASQFTTDQRGTGFARIIGAHVDIGAVELQTVALMAGNGSNGFGGSIGLGSLTLTDDGTNIFGTLYRGPDTLRDDLVLYIDSVSGGFSNTASFADGADGLRKAISGFDGGGNRSVLTNLPGFAADYAIALSPAAESFGGLWRLAAGGNNSLQFSNSVNLSPLTNNAVAYTFSFPVASIGLQPGGGGTFRFFGTLISSTGFRSDEALPGNVSGAQGWSPFNVTAVTNYTIQGSSPVTSPVITGATRLGNGSFQFGFTNTPGATFSILFSTNVTFPLNLWSNLGAPVESPAGTFIFTDAQATNSAQRFYRVSSP